MDTPPAAALPSVPTPARRPASPAAKEGAMPPDTQADPAAAPPQPGEVRAVQPGLLRARMPLPFPPGHVNVWFLEHGDGWMAVDTSV